MSSLLGSNIALWLCSRSCWQSCTPHFDSRYKKTQRKYIRWIRHWPPDGGLAARTKSNNNQSFHFGFRPQTRVVVVLPFRWRTSFWHFDEWIVWFVRCQRIFQFYLWTNCRKKIKVSCRSMEWEKFPKKNKKKKTLKSNLSLVTVAHMLVTLIIINNARKIDLFDFDVLK